MSEKDLQEWVGRERVLEDRITLFPVRGMRALLDRDPDTVKAGAPLPDGWHWLYFKPTAPGSRLGPDGHEERGEFLPPVPLPRRMWAGGRLSFRRSLTVGDPVRKTSRIESVTPKEGGSGRLVFVTVGHVVEDDEGVAVKEEQDLVYLEARNRDEPLPGRPAAPEGARWSEPFRPDEVALFRFSALTFNGHRIHYDTPYATEVEGYPGLVVHGPLIALLLLDSARRNLDGPVRSFRYRARSPLFCGEEMRLQGGGSEEDGVPVWAATPEGGLLMEATASSDPDRFGSR